MAPTPAGPVIPPLYAAWMDELLGDSIPPEKAATCADCAMCAPAGIGADGGAFFFRPDVKCCSFMPELWNFLVGQILDDASPMNRQGRASVEARISAGVSVTPIGLGRTPAYSLLYRGIGNAFGRTHGMLCPHFLEATGGCGIWRHRESTCTTYFCKHDRGATGKAFWSALQALLHSAERALTRHAILQLDPGADALELLFPPNESGVEGPSPEELDGTVDPVLARRRWGTWSGREREFYHEAARLIAPMRWREVLVIGGSELRLRAALTARAFEQLRAGGVSDRLRPAAVQVTPVSLERSRVSGYSELDPLELPRELLEVLSYFDGRSTASALQAIAREQGLSITPALVRKLVDFGILEPRA